mmetsp:Transcript_50186/g.98209  ORF Transcript_50186/g.98209 Transcript_50186/m.98209 type:complete len:177 (+) Transcript_50186:2-532(+)
MIIDKMLHEAVSLSDPHGPRQVVILGAGFDSRANRFATHLPVNKWFEIVNPTAPTLYILEGLVYYFSTEDVEALLKSIPCIPHSRIVVSVVERSLQKAFEKFGIDSWSTNYELLRSAGALWLKNYKLRRTILPCSNHFGLRVPVTLVTSLLFGTWWNRLVYYFHIPDGRVLECEAI